jgi:hypothetical protein
MAQVNIRANDAASFVAIESTHGTTPSMTRCHPIAGSVEITTETAPLENETQTTYLHDAQDQVDGVESATLKCGYYLKGPGTRLDSAATPATPPLGIFLKGLFGGEVAAAGALLDSGDTSSATCTTPAHAARFSVGQLAWADVGGTLYPCVVDSANAGTGVVGLWPTLAGAIDGADLINAYNYYPAESNAQSLCFQHALAGDSSHQWTLNGGTGSMELKLDANGLIRCDFDLKFAKHTGPSSQGISTTHAADAMSGLFAVKDGLFLYQAAATTTRTHVPVRALALKMNFGMEHLPDIGGVEGTSGVMRTGQRVFAELTVKLTGSDLDYQTTWSGRTARRMLLAFSVGSGSSQRMAALYMPAAKIVGKPRTTTEGGIKVTEMTLRSHIDTGGSTAIARAPLVLAIA